MQKLFRLLLAAALLAPLGSGAQSGRGNDDNDTDAPADELDEDACSFAQLSAQFDLEVAIVSPEYADENVDKAPTRITAYLLPKGGTTRGQKLSATLATPTGTDLDCNAYSYATGSRAGGADAVEVAIVGDYNFDGQDDIALLSGFSPVDGYTYTYYLRGAGGAFAADAALNATVRYAPSSVDAPRRQFTTQQRFDARLTAESLYQSPAAGQAGSVAFMGTRFLTADGRVAITSAGFDYLQLGMKEESITRLYGAPRRFRHRNAGGVRDAIGDISFYGTTYDLFALLSDSGAVAAIEIRDARLLTPDGIHAGARYADFNARTELLDAYYTSAAGDGEANGDGGADNTGSQPTPEVWLRAAGAPNVFIYLSPTEELLRALRGHEDSPLTSADIPAGAVVERIVVQRPPTGLGQ